MAVPRFSLADLTAAQLAEEMVRRIPANTTEWKNAQTGDPGRTLIDLFAWMGETILYRVNLLPRRQRLEFLRLLDLKLRAAAPATGVVQLHHKKPRGATPVLAPLGTRVTGPAVFETLTTLTVQPFEGRVFYKRRLETAERDALGDIIEDLAALYGVAAAEPYAATALFEDGRARPEGVDPFAGSVDRTAWIALLALEDTDASRQGALDAFDAQPALLNVGVIPRLAQPDADPAAPAPAAIEHLDWAISSTRTIGGLTQDIFLALTVEEDRTDQMRREGTLRLILPVANNRAAPANDIERDAEAGLGDKPPRVDDPDVSARLVAWLRLRPKDADGVLPLSWLGINAVALDGRETRRNIQIGTGTGRPAQSFALPARHVDPASLVVSVQEGERFVRWHVVDDLGGLGRDDRGFTLDAEAGTIATGDGLTGRGPQPGVRIRLDFMRSGGGAVGNVAAGTLAAIERAGLGLVQPAAMTGGRDAETLEAAEKRVTAHLQHHDRCITEADYKAIAGELELARVEVLPRFRPFQQRPDTPGTVSVLPLPAKAAMQPPNPRPDRRLIDQVRAYLEPRRPLATELFVIAPDYRRVGLAAAISIRDGFAREEVVNQVRNALYQFLWPLTGGGRDGAGWPLGQAVLSLETEVIVARVPGVRTTQGAALFTLEDTGFFPVPKEPATGAQALALELWQLPELMQVDVVVDGPLPAAMEDLTGVGGPASVAVPVVPEVC